MRQRIRKNVVAGATALLVCGGLLPAGAAQAAGSEPEGSSVDCTQSPATSHTGFLNNGFESGDFSSWRQGPVTDSVAVTSTDAYTAPYEGQFMARLGTAAFSGQTPGPNTICQDWIVDSAKESFAYNVFTYDYSGYDEFRFDVKVVNTETNELLASYEQGAWGSGTALKTTGWQYVELDLSEHIGEQVQLQISAGGTADYAYNMFAYVDSAEKGAPPVVAPLAGTESATGSVMTDPQTGQVTIGMPFGNKSPITITTTPDCPDGTTPTSATLFLNQTAFPMTEQAAGTYEVTIPADQVTNGTLALEVSCSGTTFVNTVGAIQLYDPSGIISDSVTGDPVVGALVHLFKVPTWTARTSPTDDAPNTCESNLSKPAGSAWSQPAPTQLGEQVNPLSPEIDPNVNPFVTNGIGYYGWNVAAGCWYVTVSAEGYQPLTSPVVGVPPEVTDLDLELTPVGAPPADTVAPTTTASAKAGGTVIASDTWTKADVTLALSASEPADIHYTTDGSTPTLSSPTYTDALSFTSGTTTVKYFAVDAAGNAEAIQSFSVKIDKTAPTLTCASAPTFLLKQTGPATVTATVSDGTGSGATASTVGSSADTSTMGVRSATVTGADLAGNTASKACEYQVQPKFVATNAATADGLTKVKAGQSIPLKFRLTDANGAPVTTVTTASLAVKSLSCSGQSAADAVTESATGSSGLQNFSDGNYQYNWKSPSSYAKSCKTLVLDFGAAAGRLTDSNDFHFTG